MESIDRRRAALRTAPAPAAPPLAPPALEASDRFTVAPAADPSAELMGRVQRGDARAFEELLLRWQDRLVTLLWHQTGDHALAEDLAQEAFLRVYRARGSYKPTARFSTWLYTIALNAAKDARQRAHRRRERGVPTSVSASTSAIALESLAVDASGRLPARQADRNELQSIVRRALADLNEHQRTAVLLSKFEQCSHEEIAEAMGLTVPAVKSLLFRARENLRLALEPYCGGEAG